tara:strand:+ start:49 stop:2478 length:2430 start_codon:yes stop_codon:yes gene_type:complete
MDIKNRGAIASSALLVACFLALMMNISPRAFAADPDTVSDEEISETIVTASFLEKSDVSTSGSAYVLSGDDIAKGATSGLGGLLDGYLGLSVTDFGGAVSMPTIRGLTGDRVKVLNNGIRTRDVSGLGADHSMDVDLFGVSQIEVVKGPASLLYTNGAIGGIVNVVDATIASTEVTESETVVGLETQTVNDGRVKFFSHQGNIGGFNVSASYQDAEFDNFDLPDGAIIHLDDMHDGDEDEAHGGEDHDEESGGEHAAGFLKNSDFTKEASRFGISKTGDWGHIGASYSSGKGLYGVPFHVEEEGAHGGHGEEAHHDEDHEGEEDHDEHEEEDDHEAPEGHDEHGDERIFAATQSDIMNLEGSLNLGGGLLKSVDYHVRNTDYVLSERHAEEEDSDDHEGEEDKDHDEHEGHGTHGAPTVFTNEAQEYGAVFDLSNDLFSQKIALELTTEDTAIAGSEAFMNPVSTDEFTLGYYVSREIAGFTVDFGIRNDWIERSGSVSKEEEHDDHEEDDHGEEDHGDEDHGDEDHDDDHSDEGHAEMATSYYNSEESVTSYGLQIARSFSDELTATLNFSSVEKAPAPTDLFMYGAHLAIGRFEVGNPNLQTEKAQSVELSFDYSSDTFFGTLTVYSNDIDNYIYLRDETEDEHEAEEHDDHGGLILANYLQQDAEFVGYEFEIGRMFQVAGGDLSLSYGMDSVSADFSDSTSVPRINPDRSIYEAAFARGSFDMSIIFKDVKSQSDIASYESATEGYAMLNVRASNRFNIADDVELNVSLFGKNLLDEVARNHSSFVKNEVPLPGRSYGLKFYATF